MQVDSPCQGEHDVLETCKEVAKKPYKLAPSKTFISLENVNRTAISTYVYAHWWSKIHYRVWGEML